MSNFVQVLKGVDVSHVLAELDKQPELWDQHKIRTSFNGGHPFGLCNDIILAYNDVTQTPIDWLETVNYPAMYLLPATRRAVHALMFAVQGSRLGRVMITRLPPGDYIGAHADSPQLCEYYTRYHLSLQDNANTVFICGGETYRPEVGEVFKFNNALEHEVRNDGDTDRLTLIVDIKKPVLQAFYGANEEYTKPKDDAAKVARPKGIHFQAEKFSDCVEEMKAIVPDHYLELALDQEAIPLAPDWDRYCHAEKLGVLHFFTARNGDELIGYHIAMIGGHIHYKTTIHCQTDIYYMKPEYRKNRVGQNFFMALEEDLKAHGVKKIITGTKLHKNHTAFFEMLGYRHTDNVMTKLLDY